MKNAITINITIEEAELIIGALIERPYKQVASLVIKFDAQVKQQLKEENND